MSKLLFFENHSREMHHNCSELLSDNIFMKLEFLFPQIYSFGYKLNHKITSTEKWWASCIVILMTVMKSMCSIIIKSALQLYSSNCNSQNEYESYWWIISRFALCDFLKIDWDFFFYYEFWFFVSAVKTYDSQCKLFIDDGMCFAFWSAANKINICFCRNECFYFDGCIVLWYSVDGYEPDLKICEVKQILKRERNIQQQHN